MNKVRQIEHMKQTACKLCGATFVCDNGMWFTTCNCARDRPDELKAAQTMTPEQKALREKPDETIAEWLDHAESMACAICRARLRAALGEVKRLRERPAHPWGRHVHASSNDGTDRCRLCGKDLRDEIHERQP